MPAGVLLDLVKVASDPNGLESQKADAAVEFLGAALEEDSLARFNAGLRDKDNPITVDQMTEVLEWLMETYQARPTEPALPSALGQSSTGRTSTAPASKPASTRSRSARAAS